MNVAEAIIEILKAEGTEVLFGYPSNPIVEAAAKADVRTIIVRQERTGLHMADAYSRMNSGRKIGVFTMQFGPGSENSFGGIAQAYSESSPILVLPSGYPRAMASRYPNFGAVRNMQHISKSAERVVTADSLPDVMRRAFFQLRNGRPGPVIVETPLDIYPQELPEGWLYEPSYSARTAPDPGDVARAAEVLAGADHPVIYAGQGVHYARAWNELKELAETWNIPVVTSLEGKSAFPEDHPLSLGSGGRAFPRAARTFLDEADVIIGIGCSFALTAYGISIPSGKTIIHATLDPMDLNKDVPARYALIGDARLTLEMLNRALSEQSSSKADGRSALPSIISGIHDSWLSDWDGKRSSNATPLSPYRVLKDLQETVDRDSCIITHDAGNPRDQLSAFWRSTTPLSYIGWGKTTQLGAGLGFIMGAKMVHPDKLCINVWGDAAIGFTGMDFETAARNQIPILSILLNNGCMAIELPGMGVATEKFHSTAITGHYADMAKAFGAYGERITDPDEIVPAIRRGIAATQNGKPALLEFITAKENAISQG